MLTLQDALKIAPLDEMRLVAGHGGLQREVTWVHNAGVPDAADWLNGGEIVLTTAINMPDTRAAQRQYILSMIGKGVTALCIAVGRYIEHIPAELRELADEYDFPLFEIPFSVRFIDVAKVINEQITQENVTIVRRALLLQQTLTQIVLDGGGLQELAEKLAELVGQSISIENDRFEHIVSCNIGDVDEARRYTNLHGRTNPALLDALEVRSVLPEIRRTLRPVHIPRMADVGLEMERYLAPIVVHGEIYGYMWIIADDHALTEFDRIAISSGSTIAALMLLHQESVQNTEASLKGTLLSQLIQGESGRTSILTDQSMRYGVDLRVSYVMMLVECEATAPQRQPRLYQQVNQLVMQQSWSAVAGQFAGQIVILAQANQHIPHIAEHLQQHVSNSAACMSAGRPGARVGVSTVLKGADFVGRAYQQVIETLHITRQLRDKRRVVYFDELGYLHALYYAGKSSLDDNPLVPCLRKLLDEQQADLFNTLEAYLDAGGNGVQTADILHIHRSTLNYRLARIHEICLLELSDPTVRMNLQVALKLMRLFAAE